MSEKHKIEHFLNTYDEAVLRKVYLIREIVQQYLPDVTEQLDEPAGMIAYCYGQRYKDLVCMIIPSKKGVKLGFNGGVHLPDPDGLLEGTGKISRYVILQSEEMIHSAALKQLILAGYEAYLQRIS